jgi:hypothetical protein
MAKVHLRLCVHIFVRLVKFQIAELPSFVNSPLFLTELWLTHEVRIPIYNNSL